MQVIVDDPTNSEAEDRLGMQWFMGNLHTKAEIDAAKAQRIRELHQLIDWKPVVTRWQKELVMANPDEQAKAKAEMRNTTDPAVIPALTWAASAIPSRTPAGRQASIAFQPRGQRCWPRAPCNATYVLTQQAVLASSAEVRSAATDELKKRQMYDYVPVLLDGLRQPA